MLALFLASLALGRTSVRPMSNPLVVLDFDGTFTDVEKEGVRFVGAYQEQLRGLLGIDAADLERRWAAAEKGLEDPETGWVIGGNVVAPANCDPYIRATCIAFAICEELGRMPTAKVRTDVLSVLYAYCYQFTDVAFRPDAEATLRGLQALGVAVHVVTNSEETVVQRKLAELGFADLPVIGQAKKYVVDVADESVADLEDLALPGLTRKVHVRRPRYRRALTELWKRYEATAATTLVCGDIFELDLALPLALGCRGHLLERPNMLPFERAALAHYAPRASSSPDLAPLVGLARSLAKG